LQTKSTGKAAENSSEKHSTTDTIRVQLESLSSCVVSLENSLDFIDTMKKHIFNLYFKKSLKLRLANFRITNSQK